MLVFGTRPEAIKMAPLVKALQGAKEHFDTIVSVTGQHSENLLSALPLYIAFADSDTCAAHELYRQQKR